MDSFSISSSFFVLPSPQKNSYLLNSPTRSPQIRQTDANDNTTSLSSPFSPVLSPTKHLSSPGKCSSSPTKKQSFSTKSSPSKKHGSKIGKVRNQIKSCQTCQMCQAQIFSNLLQSFLTNTLHFPFLT